MPNRFWTLGPELAETIFDGGARTAAVHGARATYDEDVANYRNTVLTAFQSVEDSLSSMNHLRAQANAFAKVYDSSSRLFASEQAQFDAGAVSQQNLLTQRLTLLEAQQNLRDTQALLAESNVALVKNLGGGWQRDDAQVASMPAAASSPASESAVTSCPGAVRRLTHRLFLTMWHIAAFACAGLKQERSSHEVTSSARVAVVSVSDRTRCLLEERAAASAAPGGDDDGAYAVGAARAPVRRPAFGLLQR